MLLIGCIYVLSVLVGLISIAFVLYQSIMDYRIVTRTMAKLGILAHHGMYGGMITCNIINMVFTDTELKGAIFLLVVLANFFIYWNFESLSTIKKYRSVLNSTP